jgi:hypothetical protein
VSAAYYLVSIPAGLNGLLPCCFKAHGHAFANRVPGLYSQDAKPPSCMSRAITQIAHLIPYMHVTYVAYAAYACGKKRFQAAQWTCSTAASEPKYCAPICNISKHFLSSARMILLPSWVVVLSFAWQGYLHCIHASACQLAQPPVSNPSSALGLHPPKSTAASARGWVVLGVHDGHAWDLQLAGMFSKVHIVWVQARNVPHLSMHNPLYAADMITALMSSVVAKGVILVRT